MINPKRIAKEALKIEKHILFNSKCCYKTLSKNEIISLEKYAKEDLDFFFESDPAAISKDAIKLSYPGYRAIVFYRIAHILDEKGKKLEARIISEFAHSITGIDINPSAKISSPFFIDHGTGIVIGETTIIGKNVRLYQGVTLGALSPKQGQNIRGIKRHPTILDNVTIYAGATILGDITIGNNVTVGGGVFITENIPDNSRVTLPKPILNIIGKK